MTMEAAALLGMGAVLITLKFVERLKAAGVSDVKAKAMAEAQVEVFSEATSNTLATKQDIVRLELKLTEHDGEFKLIKWMLGIALGQVALLVTLLKIGH